RKCPVNRLRKWGSRLPVPGPAFEEYGFMKTKVTSALLACGLAVVFLGGGRAQADEIPKEYRENVANGLKWLAEKEHEDGSGSAIGGQHKCAMTALAGMALLMEGSTVKSGKYAKNIKAAVKYLMRNGQRGARDGLIADFENREEATRYMYGHGFS